MQNVLEICTLKLRFELLQRNDVIALFSHEAIAKKSEGNVLGNTVRGIHVHDLNSRHFLRCVLGVVQMNFRMFNQREKNFGYVLSGLGNFKPLPSQC